MNVLAAADLVQQVRDASVTASKWLFENQAGKVLASSPAGDPARHGQPTVMIGRADLHRVLVEQVQEEGIRMHFNKSFVSLNDTPGKSVVAQFSDGSSAEGDFVVGADGIRSQVRQTIMPRAPKPVYTGMMAPGGFRPSLDSDVTPRSNQRVHFIFGQNGFFGYFNALTANGPRTAWWSTASAPLPNKERMGAAGQPICGDGSWNCTGNGRSRFHSSSKQRRRCSTLPFTTFPAYLGGVSVGRSSSAMLLTR